MSDQATTTPVPAPTETTTTAKPLTVDQMFADAQKAMNVAETAPAITPEPAPVKDVKEEPKTAAISVDPATLKTITGLQRAKRELETKIKELEAKAGLADKYSEIEAMWKAGKKLDVVGKLSGKDEIEAMQELLAQFVDAPESTVETRTAKQLADMQAKLDAVTAKEVASEAKLKEQADKQERANALAFAASKIDPAKYELCAKAENKAEMAEAATEAVPVLIRNELKEALGEDFTPEALQERISALTDDEIAAYYGKAYDRLEAHLDELGKRFQRGPKQDAKQDTPTETRPAAKPLVMTRPAVAVAPKAASKARTIDELFAEATARANELYEP